MDHCHPEIELRASRNFFDIAILAEKLNMNMKMNGASDDFPFSSPILFWPGGCNWYKDKLVSCSQTVNRIVNSTVSCQYGGVLIGVAG